MEVKLEEHFSSEDIIHKAAAITVDKYLEASKTNSDAAIASKHLSILEFLPMVFTVFGVSRSLTHQLVRHRIASYAHQSQRYAKVKVELEDWYITPDSIKHNPKACKEYKETINNIAKVYQNLIDMGMPKEDARYILPNATTSDIIIKNNGRSFIEQCHKRRCHKAQWEIRQMYDAMRECIKDVYPTVYRLSKPSCELGLGCKEQKPCGRYADGYAGNR